jgi:pimeloyl-ACP methyl ester carboxylesterase
LPDASSLTAQPFELAVRDPRLAGEELGEGPPVVLAHGVTATRRYVVHGSKSLARAGYRQISYDARAHGQSAPAPEGAGYTYAELVADLRRVIDERAGGRPVVCGDSMGCHTAAAYALAHADELAGVVLIRPATLGLPVPEETIAYWDRLADGLERDGVEGFMSAYAAELDVAADFEETVLRFTRERMGLHRDPRALARAVREVPRSLPFEGIVELESLNLPTLVVASRDEADPGHPYAVAEAWKQAIPSADLITEQPGASPLAWQGGRLSRQIAEFCERPEVAERLRG